MRFCSFFALSLFLHVSLFALLNQLHLPDKTVQNKASSLTLDIQTIHIAPPPPLPHEASPKPQPLRTPKEPKITPKLPTKPQKISKPMATTLPAPITQPQEEAPQEALQNDTQETLHVTSHIEREMTLYHAIHLAIMQHKHYPKRAQREGMEGEVVVSFTYAKEGITHLKIKTPSKHALLNAYCLELIKEASAEFPQVNDSFEIVIPVGFFLR
ncbi:TonB family protein [Sulfurospirillum deleyianum]|uniref:TonB family protein n=1 Tax=Sulfurospirillum deleyianum (strain ATCC 51133 / DSM 6946 / 5175) TaxID=525898 RepID=D1B0Y1_SULD5|nr:TonB family protein [Sulfurospirillum deleyianum]ACZ11751.1 TonB family protein [Sulfurospirillum deleyianum DSM 6946]